MQRRSKYPGGVFDRGEGGAKPQCPANSARDSTRNAAQHVPSVLVSDIGRPMESFSLSLLFLEDFCVRSRRRSSGEAKIKLHIAGPEDHEEIHHVAESVDSLHSLLIMMMKV